MTDPMASVPALRGHERDTGLAPDVTATPRDLRWKRHAGRGSIAAILLLLWLAIARINLVALGEDTFLLTDGPMIAVAVWWLTGVGGCAKRTVRMGAAMADAVSGGMSVWRQLPEPARTYARPTAAALLAAGVRHDVDGVRVRLAALDEAARAAQHRPDDRSDVDWLTDWAEGTRRAFEGWA